MAIDTSIYGNIKPVQIDSPVNMLAQVAQLQGAQNQNRLFDMQVADRDQARQSDQAVRAAYTIDDPTARSNALRLADPKAYREDQAFQATQAKTQREAEKAQLESAIQKQGIVAQYAGSAKDQASWTAAKQALSGMGIDVSQVPDQYDPNTAQTLLQRSLTGAQQLEQMWKSKGYDLDVAKFGETVRNNKTQNSIAQGNLGVAQANLGLRKQELAQNGGAKAPAGYRFNLDGSLSAIPGGPADTKAGGMPKLTEDQGKATGWLVQASNAFDNMKAATSKDTGAAKPGLGDAVAALPLAGGLGNHLRSDNRQKYVQASSSLSESLLRAATGAGVNESEAKQKIQELTPVWGDSDAVIKQKMDAIPLYIESLKVRSGPGAGLAAGVMQTKGVSKPAGGVVDFGSLK